MELQKLVTDPDGFFEEVNQFGRVRRPALVVSLVAIAYMTPVAIMFLTTTSEQRFDIRNAYYGVMISKFLVPLFLWLGLTIGIGIVARLAGGRPSYGRILRTVGYGLLSFGVAQVFWAAGRLIALDGAEPPDSPAEDFQGFANELPELTEYLAQANGEPTYIAGQAVAVVFIVAGAALMSHGVKYAAEINLTRARIATGIPVAVYLAIELGVAGIVS